MSMGMRCSPPNFIVLCEYFTETVIDSRCWVGVHVCRQELPPPPPPPPHIDGSIKGFITTPTSLYFRCLSFSLCSRLDRSRITVRIGFTANKSVGGVGVGVGQCNRSIYMTSVGVVSTASGQVTTPPVVRLICVVRACSAICRFLSCPVLFS